MRTWFYGFLELWTCTDMGLFGCLFACSCVGMSAYCLLTAPLVPQEHSPPLLVERGEESVSFYPFCYQFCKICSVFT